MSWDGGAEITGEEILATSGKSAEAYLKLIHAHGVPIGPDYLVDMEMRKNEKGTVYYYRWMRKDGP